MQKRKLGTTGTKVSAVGIGRMSFTDFYGPTDLDAVARALPVGWVHGDRYTVDQWVGPEHYC